MESIGFLFLKIRLGLCLLIFLARAFYALYPQVVAAIAVLFLVVLNNLVFIRSKIISQKRIQKENTEQIDSKKIEFEKHLHEQETHRDILYNLSLIEKREGNLEKANKYLQRARLQDPNWPLISSL